jgi:type IV secretion system protein VirB9
MSAPRSIRELDLRPQPGKTYWSSDREWREEFIYFLMVDRFQDGRQRRPCGGPGRSRADLRTNLIINTDRRTYHLELRAAERTYMASVSWSYPQDQLIALRRQNSQAEAAQPVSGGIDLARVNFRYEVTGDRAPWRPLRAFDDGKQVFIEFPRGIGQGEMPPLFVVGPEGDTSELVNYRVRGNYMIVDRLFAAAELRFGAGKNQKRVRISRTDGRPAS